ncbi:envelope-like protein, partial [Trifolium medium]|nr:envelope-like protein [Trifolium medium]
ERSSKKKQVIIPSDSEPDVEVDVQDIVTSEKKRIGGKRIPTNIPPAPLDNISFHSEESVQKWKFVYQRRIAQERELGQEALECKEIMELIESAGIMNTVTKIGRCYEKLVREFIVNITNECSEWSDEYRKVYVRGKCIKFSPTTINEYLGRNNEAETEEVDLLNKKPLPLSIDYKLLVGTHVPDIVIPKRKDVAGTSGSLPKATKDGVLAELMEVSKVLGETIRINTARKIHVDNLIKSMTQQAEEREEEVGDEEGNPEGEAN